MRNYVNMVRKTLGLLSSMVRSGENHTKLSEQRLKNALKILDKIEKCYTVTEIIDELNNSDSIDDAKMFFLTKQK